MNTPVGRIVGETPDSIANSEDKPVRPTVVLMGESFDKLGIKSGHRQGL